MKSIFIFLYVFVAMPFFILYFGTYIAPYCVPFIEWLLTPVL